MKFPTAFQVQPEHPLLEFRHLFGTGTTAVEKRQTCSHEPLVTSIGTKYLSFMNHSNSNPALGLCGDSGCHRTLGPTKRSVCQPYKPLAANTGESFVDLAVNYIYEKQQTSRSDGHKRNSVSSSPRPRAFEDPGVDTAVEVMEVEVMRAKDAAGMAQVATEVAAAPSKLTQHVAE